jgi:hypothetical protein
MNASLPDPELPRKTWADRLQALFEVILLSGLVSSLLTALFLCFQARSGQILEQCLGLFPFFWLVEAAIPYCAFGNSQFHRETLFSLGIQWKRGGFI